MALLPVTPNRHLKKFRMAISLQRIIRSTSCLILGGVFGDGGSNGPTSGWTKSKMAAGRHFAKISNGHISGTRRPIDFVSDPLVGFSGMADRIDLPPVGPNPRWRLAAILSPEQVVGWTSCLVLG